MSISAHSIPYLAIAQELRDRMKRGDLLPHQQLASQNQLAAELGVSPATVQKSLTELERDGLIWTQKGKGRFVAAPVQSVRSGAIGVVLLNSEHLLHPVICQRLAGVMEILQRQARGWPSCRRLAPISSTSSRLRKRPHHDRIDDARYLQTLLEALQAKHGLTPR